MPSADNKGRSFWERTPPISTSSRRDPDRSSRLPLWVHVAIGILVAVAVLGSVYWWWTTPSASMRAEWKRLRGAESSAGIQFYSTKTETLRRITDLIRQEKLDEAAALEQEAQPTLDALERAYAQTRGAVAAFEARWRKEYGTTPPPPTE